LVVYGHVARGLVKAGLMAETGLFELVDSVIYSFHMPLFFFLSGLFFYESLYKRGAKIVLANKIDVIVYPYVLWSFLQGGVEVALSRWTNGNVSVAQLFDLFLIPRAQFWFLYALFLCVLVGIVVYSRASKSYFLHIFLLGVVAYLFNERTGPYLQLWYVLSYFSFFSLGVLLNQYKGDVYIYRYWLVVPIGIAAVFSQWVFHIYLGKNYTAGGWLCYWVAISSLLFVVVFCMCLSDIQLNTLGALGRASMTIYLVHILAGSGARIVLMKLFSINNLAVHLFFGVCCGVLVSISLELFVKKAGCGWLFFVPDFMSVEKRLRGS
jgi:fucose 4-O-acetylase-like acetyltransferase